MNEDRHATPSPPPPSAGSAPVTAYGRLRQREFTAYLSAALSVLFGFKLAVLAHRVWPDGPVAGATGAVAAGAVLIFLWRGWDATRERRAYEQTMNPRERAPKGPEAFDDPAPPASGSPPP